MNKTEWKPWMLEHLRRFYATDTNRELQKTLGVGCEFSKGADDGRNLLMEDMAEYASYMESVYGSGPRAAE